MRGFADTVCWRCKRRYGFKLDGEKPEGCPYCNAPPPPLLANDMKQIGQMFKLLEKNASGMTPAELQRSRIQAGLSLQQAAKLLGVEPGQLNEVEQGSRTLDPVLAVAIDNCYQLGVKPENPTEGQER